MHLTRCRKNYVKHIWRRLEYIRRSSVHRIRTDKHVIEPFEIPHHWQRYRSMDWGYTKPYAVYSYAVDYDDVLYITGEYYGCKPGMLDTVHRKRRGSCTKDSTLKRLSRSSRPRYMATYRPWRANDCEIFATEGVYWVRADNDRLAGLMQVHQRLKEGKLKIFSNCVHLIRTRYQL